MPDESAVVKQREILHLPKARLNGTGVVKAPSGEVRHSDMLEEIEHPRPVEEPPAPPPLPPEDD